MPREYIKFKKYLDKFDTTFVQNKLDEGLTIRMLSDIIGIPEKRLSEMLKHFNIPVKNKGVTHIINHHYFDEIDTEEKAYFLGFLVADGCLTKEIRRSGNTSKRISFCNSIWDKSVIEKFRDAVAPSVEVKWVNRSTNSVIRRDQCSFKFTSEHMFDTLVEKYKIYERKTYDTNFKMPELGILTRHFIRGFMDGDGSYYKNSLGFVFTSLTFLEQIENFFEGIGFTTRRYIIKGKTTQYYRLIINVNKNNIQTIYDTLYKDCSICLDRKRIKFENKIKTLTPP